MKEIPSNPNIEIFRKYVYAMMLKNKIRDIKSVYKKGHSLGLSDSEISTVLHELKF